MPGTVAHAKGTMNLKGRALYEVGIPRAAREAGRRYIQPDLCHCGGFNEGRKIAALAENSHVRVVPHNPNGPISTLAGVHLGACTASFEMLEYPRQSEGEPPVFRNQPTAVDGYLEVPTGPGWGVEIDEDVISRSALEV